MSTEHDFIKWESFPSSLKMINPESGTRILKDIFVNIPITPGSTLKVKLCGRTENVLLVRGIGSYLSMYGSPDGVEYKVVGEKIVPIGYGTHDWRNFEGEFIVPSDELFLRGSLVATAGTSWFDDLEVYQDDKLIYENQFTDPDYVIRTAIKVVASAITGALAVMWGLSPG